MPVGGNPDIVEVGKNTRFTSERQPRKKGRYKSNLRKYLTDLDVTAEDAKAVIKNAFFGKNADEIRDIIEKGFPRTDPISKQRVEAEKKINAFVFFIAKNLMSDKTGGFFKWLTEWLYGGTQQHVNLSGQIGINMNDILKAGDNDERETEGEVSGTGGDTSADSDTV